MSSGKIVIPPTKDKFLLFRRLTDSDVTSFVEALKPAAFSILFTQSFEEDRKGILGHLAALRPALIIPDLLRRFHESTETLTEPHRFTACVAGLYACARPLSANCDPTELLDLVMALLPGIDVNDMWKCSDIFILLSDLLEIMWVVDFSDPASRPRGEKLTEAEVAFLAKTRCKLNFSIKITLDRF